MATSKTLKPTNVTIQIPTFTDKPDQRVNSNCIDKEADAINALSDQIANHQLSTKNVHSNATIQSGNTKIYRSGNVVSAYIEFTVNASGIPGWASVCAMQDINTVVTQTVLVASVGRKTTHDMYLDGYGSLVVPNGLPEGSYAVTFTTIVLS